MFTFRGAIVFIIVVYILFYLGVMVNASSSQPHQPYKHEATPAIPLSNDQANEDEQNKQIKKLADAISDLKETVKDLKQKVSDSPYRPQDSLMRRMKSVEDQIKEIKSNVAELQRKQK